MTDLLAQELRAECEKGLKSIPGVSQYLFQTGEPYAMIGHGGPRPGELGDDPHYDWYPNKATAYVAALTAFRDYARSKTGILHWGAAPALEEREGRFRFFMSAGFHVPKNAEADAPSQIEVAAQAQMNPDLLWAYPAVSLDLKIGDARWLGDHTAYAQKVLNSTSAVPAK